MAHQFKARSQIDAKARMSKVKSVTSHVWMWFVFYTDTMVVTLNVPNLKWDGSDTWY